MGNDPQLVSLCNGRNFLCTGKAAAESDADPQIVHTAAPHQHLIFLRRMDSLAGGQRDPDLGGYQRHRVKVVRDKRILIEHGQEGLQLLSQGNGLCGVHAPVVFDAQVHIVAQRFPDLSDPLRTAADHRGIGFKVRLGAGLVQEGRQVADSGKSLFLFCQTVVQ